MSSAWGRNKPLRLKRGREERKEERGEKEIREQQK